MPSAKQTDALILSIGEILFDVFPDRKVIGGAPFNFLYHLHQLGFSTAMLSRIGIDPEGGQIRHFLQTRHMNLDFIQTDERYPTGRVQVAMNPDGSHSFQILEEQAYDSIEYPAELFEDDRRDMALIYFGTLAQRGERTAQTIRRIIQQKKGQATLFLDLNLRKPFYNRELIETSLVHCDIMKLNDEELGVLKAMDTGLPESDDDCLKALADRYEISCISLTRGERGSWLLTGGRLYKSEALRVKTVIDTVGAGDAYAACLAAAWLRQWPGDMIIQRAQEMAQALCRIPGAIPEDDRFYDAFRQWLRR